MDAHLTMGPILFHWPAEQKKDFYFRVADEMPIDTVYLGEVICSKRSPFFERHYVEVAERLLAGGKKVVFTSLAEVMIPRERKMTEGLSALEEYEVEANDASALYHMRGQPHRIGQYLNVYNENTMAYLASQGATHFSLPSELPASALAVLGSKAQDLGVSLEVQVYGRVGLALSARCYHARSHGRVKDNCQFVCEEDPDGMELKTLSGKPFLAINGIQTLSYTCLNLLYELKAMRDIGVRAFRLSPHTGDMGKVAQIYNDVLCEVISAEDGDALLKDCGMDVPFSNGFYHGKEGYKRIAAHAS